MNFLKIISLSSLLFISLQCDAQKATKAEMESTKNSKQITANIEKIELEEMTRGARRMVTYTPLAKIVEMNGRTNTTKITSDEWEKLARLAAAIDLKNLESHESPTTARYYDGAMAATLKVTAKGTTYTSQGFDSGKPPKAFADLYFAVASPFKVK